MGYDDYLHTYVWSLFRQVAAAFIYLIVTVGIYMYYNVYIYKMPTTVLAAGRTVYYLRELRMLSPNSHSRSRYIFFDLNKLLQLINRIKRSTPVNCMRSIGQSRRLRQHKFTLILNNK